MVASVTLSPIFGSLISISAILSYFKTAKLGKKSKKIKV
jgi:hypothetical protein